MIITSLLKNDYQKSVTTICEFLHGIAITFHAFGKRLSNLLLRCCFDMQSRLTVFGLRPLASHIHLQLFFHRCCDFTITDTGATLGIPQQELHISPLAEVARFCGCFKCFFTEVFKRPYWTNIAERGL
ncbi:Uncharacterised protein [Enterobacter cloacae]|nr:Uncharacterised protein [Enterobacter cloacae]